MLDSSPDDVNKAVPAPFATKANVGAPELHPMREMNARDWRPIAALAGVAGIAATVSHRP